MKIQNQGFDHIEFVVHDISKHAKILTQMGFEKIGERTLASRGLKSALLAQGFVRILLTQPDGSHASERQEATHFLKTHTEGVCVIALEMENSTRAYQEAIHRGARSALEPKKFETPNGSVVRAEIWTPGNVRFAFMERTVKPGAARILFDEALFVNRLESPSPLGVRIIDHITNNVGEGETKAWVEWYKKVFGFVVGRESDSEAGGYPNRFVSMQPEDGRIKIPIHETPRFVERLRGSGVQHLGLLTLKIQNAVRELKKQGIPFLEIPASYYGDLSKRVPSLCENTDELNALGLLVDGDEEGYLLHLFTREIIGPFFVEFIERKNHKGFGEGNFKALIDAGVQF